MKVVVELTDGERIETEVAELIVTDFGNGLVGIGGVVVNSFVLRTIKVVQDK